MTVALDGAPVQFRMPWFDGNPDISVPITVTQTSARLVLLFGEASTKPQNITYGAQNLTLLSEHTSSNSRPFCVYGLDNPTVGTANLVIHGGSNDIEAECVVAVFAGADLALPVGVAYFDSTSTSPYTLTVNCPTGGASLDLIEKGPGGGGLGDGSAATVAAGQTLIGTAVGLLRASASYKMGASSSMGWTWPDGLNGIGHVVAVISPIGAGPDTTAPTMTGSIATTAITTTTYTLTWPAASDNVAVTGYEVSVDGGTSYSDKGNVLTTNITGRTAGATDAVRVRAYDAANNKATPLTANVTLTSSGDTVSPVMAGAIANSAITTTGFTLTWTAASDNVAVTGYETSTDGGTTYQNAGNVLTAAITGKSPSTAYATRVRAYDAAGNRATPLSGSVTTADPASGTLTTPPMKNNTGALHANATGVAINVYNKSTGALVVRKSGLTTNSAGVCVVSDSLIVAGTEYAYEPDLASLGRRLPLATAT